MSRLDTSSLSGLSRALRTLPRALAQEVARRAAPEITKFANESFDRSQDPYGTPWAPGVHGQKVTLEQTGRLRRFIKYVAIGTKLRVALGVAYAKYQIGKRPVYPRQGGKLPAAYQEALAKAAHEAAKEHLLRGWL